MSAMAQWPSASASGIGDPIGEAAAWMREASERGLALPEACCLATCSPEGRPSARMVLCRGIDRGRFVFFTDYRSRKARELEAVPHAALVFHWEPLERQLRIEGTVERLEADASDRYFLSRPRASRISAWTSRQSEEIESRAALDRAREETERRFDGREVTRPPHWGGYALHPARIEFWRGRDDRFHERLVFRRGEGGWEAALLQP